SGRWSLWSPVRADRKTGSGIRRPSWGGICWSWRWGWVRRPGCWRIDRWPAAAPRICCNQRGAVMKTLSIGSHKGGSGKTSSSVMLAEERATRGLRVTLVDADGQNGAGLLLGIEQAAGHVQQTRIPRLRYFSCAGLPLRELPARARDFDGLFDVAVVD